MAKASSYYLTWYISGSTERWQRGRPHSRRHRQEPCRQFRKFFIISGDKIDRDDDGESNLCGRRQLHHQRHRAGSIRALLERPKLAGQHDYRNKNEKIRPQQEQSLSSQISFAKSSKITIGWFKCHKIAYFKWTNFVFMLLLLFM